MFRVEQGASISHEANFLAFFDHRVEPLLRQGRPSNGKQPRPVFLHVIAPESSPDDQIAYAAHQEAIARGLAAPAIAGTEDYVERLKIAKELGCVTTRLQIAPGNRISTPPDGPFIRWQYDLCRPFHTDIGEGSKVAWWEEQQGPLALALADGTGPAMQQELIRGVEENFPVGGHWVLYADETMESRILIAEVMYRRERGVVTFNGFDVYEPDQMTTEALRYVTLWRNVYLSSQDSLVLHDMVPIP